MNVLVRTIAVVAVAVPLALIRVDGTVEAGQTVQQVERDVRDTLRGERDLRDIEVSVEGNEVTLAGRVPTFWAKDQAIKRTLDVGGVETVISELEIPVVEDDADIVEDVGKAVMGYAHYTMFDQLAGRVDKGVVWLSGRVTPDRDKAGDIFERVAKVRGVQDVQSDIETLPFSQPDMNLRRAIGNRVFASQHFERFRSMSNPPFHIIVENSYVTLVGYVQTQIEMIEMQRIVAQTQGVIRVDNQIEVLQ
jgi:osmotically-inducible protein OsmY